MIRTIRNANGTWTTTVDDPQPAQDARTTYSLRSDRSRVAVTTTIPTDDETDDETDEEPCWYCPDGMPCRCASDSTDPIDL
jgi:hypothetical protein